MTKYIIGEIFSSSGATLYKNPSDQTVNIELKFTFPDTCNCYDGKLNVESHPDFLDGALLQHPIIRGQYDFKNDATDLHPKGYFQKIGMIKYFYNFQLNIC